jgi:hypothetical protein
MMWVDQRGSEVLTVPECHRLLAVAAKEGLTGRLAVGNDTAPIVVPVNFAVLDHQILIRIGTGTLLESAVGRLVAFETDDLDRVNGQAWSVLVRGLAAVLEPTETIDRHHLPHPLVLWPGNTVLVVRPDVVSGRRFVFSVASGDSPQSSTAPESRE